MQPDDEVCLCFHVTRRKIENYLRIHRPSRPSQLSQCGGAGTGCGWCVPFLRRYFEKAQVTSETLPLTKEQYASQRAAYIQRGKIHEPTAGSPETPTQAHSDEPPSPESSE